MCLINISNGFDVLSCSCKEFRLEDNSMKPMFGNVDKTHSIVYKFVSGNIDVVVGYFT